MNFIKAKFLKNGVPSGRSYTYSTKLELQPGDKVDLSGGKIGVVVDEPVDPEWVETYGADNLKRIERKVECEA